MPVSEQQSKELQRVTSKIMIILDEKIKKMFDDKKETPKLLIPKNLPTFAKSKNFIQFSEAVYEYCLSFNEILKQYEVLKATMANRVGDDASLLRKEKEHLGKLEREVSYHYAAIIISFNSQCMDEEKKRSNFKDQVFFEALIYLVERIMKEFFNRESFVLIQEEINRLFRTNRYNLIKKRHENDELLHRYPALKEQKSKNKNNLTSILSRAPDRINAYKKYQKEKRVNETHDYTETLGLPKEQVNPDLEQRSPLLCTWLPSRKSMLGDFSQSSAYSNYLQNSEKRSSTYIANVQGAELVRSRIASFGNQVLSKKEI